MPSVDPKLLADSLDRAGVGARLDDERIGELRGRAPAASRALAVSILVVAMVTTACGAAAATPKASAVVAVQPATTASASPNASVTMTAPPKMSLAPPPGGRVAYGRFSPGGTHVFTAKTDGTDEKALLSSIAEGPRWSPDGRHISVVGQSPEGLLFVGLVNSDGSDYLRFRSPDPTLNLGCAAWSPDGSRLACEGWDDTDLSRNGIYTVRASDGGGLTRVTTSPGGAHDVPGDYSPDGGQIVFVRDGRNGLMLVNVDGSHEHALTDRKVGGGSWSPDGKTILTDADGSLLLVPVDGSQPRSIRIVADATMRASRGDWSPDGAWIVFSGVRSAGEDIYFMRVDGTDLHQVTDTPGQDEEFGTWEVAGP